MLDKNKCDAKLGKEVNDYLVNKGVQTPMTDTVFTEQDKLKHIERSFKDIMNNLGLDLEDDSLAETPKRFAKMYVKELFWGLNPDYFPKCTTVDNKMHYKELVMERNVTSMSLCEHHFVNFHGSSFFNKT